MLYKSISKWRGIDSDETYMLAPSDVCNTLKTLLHSTISNQTPSDVRPEHSHFRTAFRPHRTASPNPTPHAGSPRVGRSGKDTLRRFAPAGSHPHQAGTTPGSGRNSSAGDAGTGGCGRRGAAAHGARNSGLNAGGLWRTSYKGRQPGG